MAMSFVEISYATFGAALYNLYLCAHCPMHTSLCIQYLHTTHTSNHIPIRSYLIFDFCLHLFICFLFLWLSGDPEPNITWTKDGAEINRRLGQVVYNKWSIVLEDLVPFDSGSYDCKVCNIHKCINYTTQLKVLGMETEIKIFLSHMFNVVFLRSQNIKFNAMISTN